MANPMDAPPPPPPPGAYAYPPVAPPAPPHVPLSERFAPENMSSRGTWAFLGLLGQGIGLLLVFVGTLIMVVAGSVPGSCYASATSCNLSTAQGIVNGILAARLLMTIGLFGLAAGSGLRLQFTSPNAVPVTPEGTQIYLAKRRGELAVLIVSIVLLFLLLAWATATPGGLPVP